MDKRADAGRGTYLPSLTSQGGTKKHANRATNVGGVSTYKNVHDNIANVDMQICLWFTHENLHIRFTIVWKFIAFFSHFPFLSLTLKRCFSS